MGRDSIVSIAVENKRMGYFGGATAIDFTSSVLLA
jgi:hypothetical protein